MKNQNIEWKESWRDEYLKWICGFANGDGGKLLIGVNDKGDIVGVKDAKKLMEEIPNKIKDILGIIVDIKLEMRKSLQFLELYVDAYPYYISYKGQYYLRSRSTKQELKGAALDKFLLRKQGKHWDAVPIPKVYVKQLSNQAFNYFRNRANKTNRLTTYLLKETNAVLTDKLHLMESGYLKRAAILLFHPHPEKLITGAYVKIGFFATDDDLVFQDEIHGDLFTQVEKTMDLLLTKYLKATISYNGINRIEEYPYPEAALREALLNAIAHKDYSSGNPIQISVYNNKIIFWNDGQLPDNWTVKRLITKHPSKPFNPDIAATFFRAGLIEAWGRGTIKIMQACKLAGLPAPVFTYEPSGLTIEFKGKVAKGTTRKAQKATQETTREVQETTRKTTQKTSQKMGDRIIEIIKANPAMGRSELSNLLGDISEGGVRYHLEKLKARGIIKRVGADKGGYWEIID